MRKNIAATKLCIENISAEIENTIIEINSGGCAVFAVELVKRLNLIGFVNAKLRTYGYAYNTKGVIINNVEQEILATNGALPNLTGEWNDNGVWFNHVRVEWQNRLWDSEGACSLRHGRSWGWGSVIQDGDISVPALDLLCKPQRNWNDTFDRKQIPNVKAIMDKHFTLLTGDAITV
jgi:hypothetical protein